MQGAPCFAPLPPSRDRRPYREEQKASEPGLWLFPCRGGPGRGGGNGWLAEGQTLPPSPQAVRGPSCPFSRSAR